MVVHPMRPSPRISNVLRNVLRQDRMRVILILRWDTVPALRQTQHGRAARLLVQALPVPVTNIVRLVVKSSLVLSRRAVLISLQQVVITSPHVRGLRLIQGSPVHLVRCLLLTIRHRRPLQRLRRKIAVRLVRNRWDLTVQASRFARATFRTRPKTQTPTQTRIRTRTAPRPRRRPRPARTAMARPRRKPPRLRRTRTAPPVQTPPKPWAIPHRAARAQMIRATTAKTISASCIRI